MSFVLLAILLAVFSGVLNGTFSLPMKFMSRWNWENMWAVFIVTACVAIPAAMAFITIRGTWHALAVAPVGAVIIALATGFAWGFGAIMFGQGVSTLGLSMGNTLVLAISASLGSFLPMVILAPQTLFENQGKAVVLGTVIGIAGVGICGYAGVRRERWEKEAAGESSSGMFGESRPFWAGFLICAGAGLLSAVFNIGYASAQGVLKSAQSLGNSAFAGSNLIWLLMLTAGAVSNLIYCGYLLRKNRSWSKYSEAHGLSLWGLAVLMGLLWGGGIFVYGLAAPMMGKLGPAIGWPLSLTASLLTANVWGVITGEWKKTRGADRAFMAGGLAVLLGAIITLGWSSTLG